MGIKFAFINDSRDFSENLVEDVLKHLKVKFALIHSHIYKRGATTWNTNLEFSDGSHYFIDFFLKSINTSKHLHVKIFPQSEKKEYDLVLEQVKFEVKKYFLENWKVCRCIWIEDAQILQLSEKFYPKINTAETLFRSFINSVMEFYFGASWWNIVSLRIKEKYNARSVKFKRRVPSFNNVVDNLISIDVGDLIEIINHKIKKWVPVESLSIEQAIIECKADRLLELMRNQLTTKIDLWRDIFSHYLSGDFIKDWREFEDNRNHIAHNKPIDLNAFNLYIHNVDKIISELEEARKKFEQHPVPLVNSDDAQGENITDEDTPDGGIPDRDIRDGDITDGGITDGGITDGDIPDGDIPDGDITDGGIPDGDILDEDYYDYDDEDYEKEYLEEELLKEIKETEAGVEILDSNQILEIFKEVAQEFAEEFDNDLYFRQDLIVSTDELNEDSASTILQVRSNLFNSIITVNTQVFLNDDEGEESTLELKLLVDGDEVETLEVYYTNALVEYDSEQCYYVPLNEGELSTYGINKFKDCVEDKINELFPNLVEEAESQNAHNLVDGSGPVNAEVECSNCGEQAISIDEDFFEVGRCYSCGCAHELHECIRCGKHTLEEETVCDECADYINEQ